MLSGYSFRPRGWALALAVAACAAGIALGNWQSGRAEEKRALAAKLEAAMRSAPTRISPAPNTPDLTHKRVSALGVFVPEHAVLLDNKQRRGRPGYEVIMPLKLANSEVHVLVNRGWVSAPPTRDVLPRIATPPGEVRIEGIAFQRLAHVMEAKPPARGRVRQNLEIGDFVAETGLVLKATVIEQHSALDDGLARDWPRPDFGIEKHESYSLQWYSLAALALVLGAVFSFRKK